MYHNGYKMIKTEPLKSLLSFRRLIRFIETGTTCHELESKTHFYDVLLGITPLCVTLWIFMTRLVNYQYL